MEQRWLAPVSPILAPTPFGPGVFTPAPPLTDGATSVLDVPSDPTTAPGETLPPTTDAPGSPAADAATAPDPGGDLTLPEDQSTSTTLPSPGLGPGPLPVPGPVITPPLPGLAGASGSAAREIPPDQQAVIRRVTAGSACHLPWTVLAGVAGVESAFGTNMGPSSATGSGG